MHHRVPVPVLQPKCNSNGAWHLCKAILGTKRKCAVTSSSINNTSGHNSAHLGQGALMFFANDIRKFLSEGADLSAIAAIALLHVDQGSTHKCSLPDVVSHVVQNRLEHSDTVRIACPSHGDTNSHTTRIPDMWIEALQQEFDKQRNPLRSLIKNKCQSNDRCHSNIIADITHGSVQQNSDGLIRASTAVGQRQGILSSVPQDRITVASQFLDQGVCVLFLPKLHESQTHRNSANNLLVLSLTSVIL